MTECRFCSRKLNENENHSTINEEIKEFFIKLTQIDLFESDLCSSLVCELCLRSLQLANALRIQLLKNEQKLYELIEKDDPPSPIQYYDPPLSLSNQLIKKVKLKENKSKSKKARNSKKRKVSSGQTVSTKLSLQQPVNPSNETIIGEIPPVTTIHTTDLDIPSLEVHIKTEKEYQDESIIITEKDHADESSITPQNEEITEKVSTFQIKRQRYPSDTQFINYSIKQEYEGQKNSQTIMHEIFDVPSEKRSKSSTNSRRGSEKVIHKNPITNNYECTHCSFATNSQHIMKSHLIDSHQAEIQSYKCPHCESSYFKGSNLKRHIMVKHMNKRCSCIAPNCNAKFQDRSSIRRHLIQVHGKALPAEEIKILLARTRFEAVND